MPQSWQSRACDRVRAAVGSSHRVPWDRGLWVTGRERYDEVELPEGFDVVTRHLAGAPRRLAHRPGSGRPLLILPGLYAGLTERLFATIATQAALGGRPVVLLEDRLAAATVALAGSVGLDPATSGRALDELVTWLGQAPDVLALSAGLVSAWSADPAALHRVAAFSGIRDPAATARQVCAHMLVRRHFVHCHAHSGLDLSFDELMDRFQGWQALEPPGVPSLLVHAADDPVVPIASLDDLEPSVVCRLPAGGHLGFGVLAGPRVYLLPLEDELDG